MEITLGDLIGYALTFFFGIASGVGIDRFVLRISNSNKVTQNKNTVTNGDIVAGDKHG